MANVTLKNGGGDVTNYQPKQKRYWWKYLLFWIGGSISGVVVFLATIAIVLNSVSVKNIFGIIGMDPNPYVGIQYQGYSVVDLVMTAVHASSTFETLEDVNRLTPLVEKEFQDLNAEIIEKNLHFTIEWDDVRYKPFEKKESYATKDYTIDTSMTVGDYLKDAVLDGVKIANFIHIGEDTPEVIKYFLYDIERDSEGKVIFEDGNPKLGKAWSLKDFMNQPEESSKPEVDSAPEIDTDDVKDNDFFKHVIDNVMDCTRLTDLGQSINPDDPLISAIKDYTFRDILNGELNNIKIGSMIGIEDNALLGKLFNLTLGELNDFDFNNAKFNDLLTINYPYVYDSEQEKYVIYTGDISKLEHIYNEKGEEITKDDLSPLFLRTLGNIKASDISSEESFYNFQLNELLDITSSSPKLLQVLGEKTLYQIINDDPYSTIKIKDVFNVITNKTDPNYNALLDSLKEYTLGQLQDEATYKNISIGSLFNRSQYDGTSGPKDKVVLALLNLDEAEKAKGEGHENGVTLGNISTLIGGVQLDAFFDDEDLDSPLMQAIAKETISSVPSMIASLKVKNVMDVEVGSFYHDTDDNKVYYKDENGNWVDISELDATEKAANLAEYEKVKNHEGDYAGKTDLYYSQHLLSGTATPTSETTGIARNALFEIRDVVVTDASGLIGELKSRMKLGALVDINSSSPLILQRLKHTTLDQIPTVLQTFTLADVIPIDSGSPKILQTLQTALLFSTGEGGLSAMVSSLCLSDAIDIVYPYVYDSGEGKYVIYNGELSEVPQVYDKNGNPIDKDSVSPKLIRTLGSLELDGFGSLDISSMTFKEIMSRSDIESGGDLINEIWEGDPSTTADDGLFSITGDTVHGIPSLTDRVKGVRFITLVGPSVYSDPVNHILTPTWWMLLSGEDEYSVLTSSQKANRDYDDLVAIGSYEEIKIQQVDRLISNISYHMTIETIGTLEAAGFISLDAVPESKREAIRGYTISQILALASAYVS